MNEELRVSTAVLYTVISAFSAVGFGSILSKYLRIRPNAGERGMLGLLCMGIVAGLVHFFIPISPLVQYAVLIAGLFGCVSSAAELGGWRTIAYAILAFALVFFREAYVPYHDNGLYHVPTFLWNTQAAAIPGLVNLHGRFGFNSVLFLIAPITSQYAIGWVANALLASFTILACIGRLRDHAIQGMNPSAFWFLMVTAAAFTLDPNLMGWLGILNADGFVAALTVYWVFLLFEHAEGVRPDTTPALILLLAVFALMVKLGSLPIFALTIGIMAYRPGLRPSRGAIVVATAFLTIWVARGLLLSGCLAYPIQQSCFYSLPWSVEQWRAMGEMNGIRSWARAPGRIDYDVVLSDFKWFGAWLADARLKEPIPQLRWALPLGLGALVFRLLAKQKIDRASLGIAAFLAGSIAFWFWGAPDPRFGVGFLASAGVLCVGFAAASVFSAQKLRLAAIPVLLAGVAVQTVRSAITENWRNQPAIPPQPQTFYVMTIDGPWGVPIRAPDPHDDQCWDTPLPCMPAQFLAPAYLARVRWRPIPTHGAASTAMAGSANAFTKLPLKVNAGGSGYSDSEGHAWQPDMGAQQGWAMSTTATISGTANPEVYQSARWSDTGRLSYQFTVPNGDYTVILKFAEFFYWTKGKREFDIALNGTTVASRFDIVAAAGGVNTATDLEYPLTVTNSQATVTLTGVTREPLINGIEILPASGPSGAEVKTHGSGAGVTQAK